MEIIKRVGVFDSGIGGLTVLSECLARMKGVKFFYLGDNENAPYGSKSEREITALVRDALRVFEDLKVDAAVLACNTATAVCADIVRREFSFPVVGTEPAILPAARVCKNLLVLCTSRTAESERLQGLIDRCADCKITVYACPRLAEAIEHALTLGLPFSVFDHLPEGSFDGVVLGCTHYSFFRREISEFYGAPVFDGNEGIARRLQDVLSGGKSDPKWSENTEINKSSPIEWSENVENEVIFCGNSGEMNEKIYKQTFALSNLTLQKQKNPHFEKKMDFCGRKWFKVVDKPKRL